MMKKQILVLAAVLAAAQLSACGGAKSAETKAAETTAAAETTTEAQSEAPTETTAAGDLIAEVPNPMVEVKSAADLEKLGVKMEAPEGAENVTYWTISGEVAQIDFTLKGLDYTYRGSATAEDFAGIFEEFEEKEEGLSEAGADEDLRIRTTVSKGRLVDWKKNGKNYTLYTPGPAETGDLQELCVNLISLQ